MSAEDRVAAWERAERFPRYFKHDAAERLARAAERAPSIYMGGVEVENQRPTYKGVPLEYIEDMEDPGATQTAINLEHCAGKISDGRPCNRPADHSEMHLNWRDDDLS